MTSKLLKAGVVGWPINHSLSPTIHKYWLSKYCIRGEYISLAVEKQNFKRFITELSNGGWRGVNVTLPYKTVAMEVVDTLDPNAERMGAVNTITVQKDGTLKGSNTDGYGFLKNLEYSQSSWSVKDGPIVVLGAGGAARAILATLTSKGCSEIRLVNRDQDKANWLAREIDDKIKVYGWPDRSSVLNDVSLLINTTSLGMIGQKPLKIDLEKLPLNAVVHDIVYNPVETDLLRNARLRGNRAVDGLGMLLHQACLGFFEWFGVNPKVSEDLRNKVLNAMTN
jgi:shikimate dehydrogenase